MRDAEVAVSNERATMTLQGWTNTNAMLALTSRSGLQLPPAS
jgi:hypothetical protein